MRLLILGAGGVGSAAARIAARREFLSHVVLADYDLAGAQAAVAGVAEDRYTAARLDASDQATVEQLIAAEQVDALAGDYGSPWGIVER